MTGRCEMRTKDSGNDQSSKGDVVMEYLCPVCRKVLNTEMEMCSDLVHFFAAWHGKKIWRIRFLNQSAYQFFSDKQLQAMAEGQPLILANAASWEKFDAATMTGTDTSGKVTSIFE